MDENFPSQLTENTELEKLVTYFKHYKAAGQFIDIKALQESPNLKLKKYKNCVFYGIIQNGLKNGKGIMIYFNTRLYEGDWLDDKKNGKAIELYPNGSKYEGCFVKGKREGKGQFIWVNGEIYDGEWRNGVKHGSGMW